jgi:hypothetical protein
VTHKTICKKISILTKKVNIQFARLQNRESIKNGPEDREVFRINLGSFSYDNLQQLPDEYIIAVEDLVDCKWQFLRKVHSWESYQAR